MEMLAFSLKRALKATCEAADSVLLLVKLQQNCCYFLAIDEWIHAFELSVSRRVSAEVRHSER